ncbi:hypothetical protein BS78_02G112700 [Paspalum vaginatum]|nr:hypothetical protein BS78_02G112700 [Paspalum vaginatum]
MSSSAPPPHRPAVPARRRRSRQQPSRRASSHDARARPRRPADARSRPSLPRRRPWQPGHPWRKAVTATPTPPATSLRSVPPPRPPPPPSHVCSHPSTLAAVAIPRCLLRRPRKAAPPRRRPLAAVLPCRRSRPPRRPWRRRRDARAIRHPSPSLCNAPPEVCCSVIEVPMGLPNPLHLFISPSSTAQTNYSPPSLSKP